MKEILTINIKTENIVTIKGSSRTVSFVGFSGNVRCGYFSGSILPGAADTQTFHPDGSGSLSARYILEGVDHTGERCRIFIENNADMGSEYTSPQITTDSAALSWLETAELIGKIETAESSCIIIRIYEKTSLNAH